MRRVLNIIELYERRKKILMELSDKDMALRNVQRKLSRNNLLLVKLLSCIIESRNKEASVHIKHVSTITWELLKTWQNLYPEDAFSEDDMKLSLNFTTVIY